MSYNPAVSPSSFQFGQNSNVGAGGTIQLLGPDSTTSGFALSNKGRIVGGSINVAGVSGNDYDMKIQVNGIIVAAISLPSGTSTAFADLSIPVVAGDVITVFMVRTSGSGSSSFNEIQGIVQISNISNIT